MPLTLGYLGLLSTSDKENVELAAFFGDVLGLPVDGDAASGYAEVRTEPVPIALHRGAMVEFAPIGGILLQVACDDVDVTAQNVLRSGGTLALGPSDTDWGTRHAYVRGPQGLLVELYSS